MTSRDPWVYNFNRKTLTKNIKNIISFYKKELERYRREKRKIENIDDFINNDSTKIKWTRRLKFDLKKEKVIKYDEKKIRLSLYRPFCKTNLLLWQGFKR